MLKSGRAARRIASYQSDKNAGKRACSPERGLSVTGDRIIVWPSCGKLSYSDVCAPGHDSVSPAAAGVRGIKEEEGYKLTWSTDVKFAVDNKLADFGLLSTNYCLHGLYHTGISLNPCRIVFKNLLLYLILNKSYKIPILILFF